MIILNALGLFIYLVLSLGSLSIYMLALIYASPVSSFYILTL